MPFITVDGKPVHVKLARGRTLTAKDRNAIADMIRAMNVGLKKSVKTTDGSAVGECQTFGHATVHWGDDNGRDR